MQYNQITPPRMRWTARSVKQKKNLGGEKCKALNNWIVPKSLLAQSVPFWSDGGAGTYYSLTNKMKTLSENPVSEGENLHTFAVPRGDLSSVAWHQIEIGVEFA
jgi:hypothetical protein